MRSRYTAYVRGEIDYLVATARGPVDRAAIAAWSRDTEWLGLEVVASESRGDEAFIAFVARGVTRGKPFAQRERSRFRRIDGRWYYLDGVPFAQPRNEPCACGSGKKFKRCHGA